MVKQVYFLGIGGIGMSALARYFKHAGIFTAGYDRTPSELTDALEQEGITIHFQDDPNLIPSPIKEDKDNTLIIYTPAIPHDHQEWLWLQKEDYKIVKRSAALGQIANSKNCLAVAGTHGKTTTTTLLTHILTHSGIGCTAFLGGISKNYHTNLLLSHSPFLVAEADEFDRSFLQLHPQMAIITAMDADHLDIYGDARAVEEAFISFASQIRSGGALVLKEGLASKFPQQKPYTLYSYSYNKPCDFYSSHQEVEEGGCYRFQLHLLQQKVDCRLGIPGQINVENAVAAAAIALLNGVSPQQIAAALTDFKGVSRRFDIQFNQAGRIYIDDYAHHPAEITASLSSIRNMYPGRKITAIFQPHLYTRTRDFADGFGESLSLPDELILLPIYPAREEPIEGVSSQMLLNKVSIPNKKLVEKSKLLDVLRSSKLDILVTIGAGDIDRFVPQIRSLLEEMS